LETLKRFHGAILAVIPSCHKATALSSVSDLWHREIKEKDLIGRRVMRSLRRGGRDHLAMVTRDTKVFENLRKNLPFVAPIPFLPNFSLAFIPFAEENLRTVNF